MDFTKYTHSDPRILHYYVPVCDSPLYALRNRIENYIKRNRRRSWANPMTAYEQKVIYDIVI